MVLKDTYMYMFPPSDVRVHSCSTGEGQNVRLKAVVHKWVWEVDTRHPSLKLHR